MIRWKEDERRIKKEREIDLIFDCEKRPSTTRLRDPPPRKSVDTHIETLVHTLSTTSQKQEKKKHGHAHDNEQPASSEGLY